MKQIIAIDWGTSSLRAALLDAQGNATEERSAPQGIAHVAPGRFPEVFDAICGDWLRGTDALSLICGMAGSKQGWSEAPYCPCPATQLDLVARLHWVVPGKVAIVPGVRCGADGVPDVIRGEETQVFGLLALLGLRDARVVLPGTHSKWVIVTDGRLERFATFMTGEFYGLLRTHSILARTMTADDGELDERAFVLGVEHALAAGNLLHAAFSARTLRLFDGLRDSEAPSYLSGLLIGEELRTQRESLRDGLPLVLAGADALTRRYAIALRCIGTTARVVGAEATWRGVWSIAQSMETSS